MNEVCPSCGSWVDRLDERTGWCEVCAGYRTCATCDQAKPPDDFRYDKSRSRYRTSCRICQAAQEREIRLRNIEEHRARDRARNAQKRAAKLLAKATISRPPSRGQSTV